MNALKTLSVLHFKEAKPIVSDSIKILGLDFKNRLGLAAGMDKNADYIDALSYLGFSFLELGTLTPKGQKGNFKPRLFRIKEAASLIQNLYLDNGYEVCFRLIGSMHSSIVVGRSFSTLSNFSILDPLRRIT